MLLWGNAPGRHGDMLRFKVFGLGVIILISLLVAAVPASAGMKRNGVMQTIMKKKKARGRVSSGFGIRRDPIGKFKNFHKGIDVSGPSGTRIIAYKEGTVVFSGWMGAYGRMVDIDHGNGLMTRYAHLKSIRVKRGDRVGKDHAVGLLGRTGRATGNNLHFEVMVNGKPSDPRRHVTDASALLWKDAGSG